LDRGEGLECRPSEQSDDMVFWLLADTFTPTYHYTFGEYHSVS
jgi:hypothetical protein